MFALRRAALRTFTHSSWQALASRPASLAVSTQIPRLTAARAFHLSRSWRASGRDELTLEQEVKEEGTIASEVADIAKASTLSTDGQPASDTRHNVHVRPSPSTLYVGNLLFDVTQDQLEAEFAQQGDVVSCTLATDPQGRSRGYGYIQFATPEEATGAINALDQKQFQGRRMSVQVHKPRERFEARPSAVSTPRTRNEPSSTLFIGNMAFEMSDKDLNEMFRDIKDVTDVRVAIDRRSGQPRGFAHADFTDIAAAENAKAQLEGKFVFGRVLRVDFSKSSAPRERE